MKNASPSKQSSEARRNRKLISAIEGLEPRAYLAGVAFGNPIPAATGVSPLYVDLENLYGTGHADLITANSDKTVSILQGTGAGTFTAVASPIPLGFAPLTIRAGKLGSNGMEDIVIGSSDSNTIGVVTQDTSHNFTEQPSTATGLSNTRSVAIGDFNNDGLPDIAVASLDNGTTDNVAIFLNGVNGNPAGTFTLSQTLSVPHTQLASITSYAAATGGTNLAVADASSNSVSILNNDGTGSFTVGSDYPVGGEPVTIVDGQFDKANGDNNDDLVTANAGDGTVSTLLQQPNGTFASAISTTVPGAVPGNGPLKVRMANLNADNLPDLICLLGSGASGDAEVLLGNGNGTFHVGNLINTGSGPYTAIAAGDLNGDQLTDMVLASQTTVTSLLNTTNLDTTPPTASIGTSQVSVSTGAATIDFTVTYTDVEQVDTSTLNNNNVTVTTPSGASDVATLVSTGLAPAPSVTVTYQIPALGGAATQADTGTYTVIATSSSQTAVQNANGLTVAGGTVGQFAVNVLNPNGPNLVPTVTVNNPVSAVAGARFAGATRVTIVNAGNQAAKGKIVIDLFASPSQTVPSGTPVLVSATRNINLKPGAKVVEALPGFKWPATPGTDFIVAQVNATQTITETNFADNFGISARPTDVAAPFVNIENLWSGKLPATLKVGRRTPLAVALKNLGNTVARATAAYTVQAEDANSVLTTIQTGTVRIAAAAQGRQTVSIPLTVPSTLASGTYHLVITVSYPGDTNSADDSATSATTFNV